VTALLAVPAAAAFDFMRDPPMVGCWSLGSRNAAPTGSEGVFAGHSLFDGGQVFFEVSEDPERFIVDYLVGTLALRTPRISARVVRADVCGLEKDQCYVTLTAWRTAGMDDARWHQLCVAHEVEILLIKAQCEAKAR
jgi:hypothetical protein